MKKILPQIAAGLVLLFLSAASTRAADRRALHTGGPAAAASTRKLSRLPATNRLHFSIGLPLRNGDTLTNLVSQLYIPGSPKYRQYLTPAQFTAQFGPAEQDYQNVIDYARSNHLDIERTYGNRALLSVSGNVSDIEGAFQVHMGLYQHPTEHREFFAPDVEPTVPASLSISYIVGLDNYILPHPKLRKTVADSGGAAGNGDYLGLGSGTNGWYQGNDLRTAYVPGVSLKGSGQIVGLFELDGFTPGDITKYESLANLSSVPPLQTVVISPANGSVGGNNDEVALDIEMVISMAPGLQKVLVVEGYTGVDAMNELASPSNGVPLANQVSSSWGFSGESQIEPQLIEMAAQGQTFFLASGDSGAPAAGQQSSSADYNYLTTVGGTELYMSGTAAAWQAETVWDYQFIQGASTGYIETALAIPAYQSAVNPAANGGSSVYRNVPDVAMVADYLVAVYTETFTNGNPSITGFVNHIGGTSAAAPLWAAFTSLVNEQAAAQGQPTVGFLNPALYGIAQSPAYTNCFHDVTNGNNISTNSNNLYTAGPGYDNCTGLGSPNGPNLINALTGYAGPIFVNFNYNGTQKGSYAQPYNTIAGGIGAVSAGGTIIIETAGSTSETPVITKAMTITASDGAATIGN